MLCFSGTSDWWLPCKALDLAHTVPSDGIVPLHSHAHFTHSCLRSLGCYPIRCLVLVLHPSGIVISTGSCHPHRGSPAGPHQAIPPLQGLFHVLPRDDAEEMCAEMKWQYACMFPELGLGWLLLSQRKVEAVGRGGFHKGLLGLAFSP